MTCLQKQLVELRIQLHYHKASGQLMHLYPRLNTCEVFFHGSWVLRAPSCHGHCQILVWCMYGCSRTCETVDVHAGGLGRRPAKSQVLQATDVPAHKNVASLCNATPSTPPLSPLPPHLAGIEVGNYHLLGNREPPCHRLSQRVIMPGPPACICTHCR